MPVRELGRGHFQWGKSGKVYTSRAKAEAQMRAAFASGWREDRSAKARRTRRELALLFRASRKAEARYVRDLLAILRAIHKAVAHLVLEQLRPAHPDLRTDAVKIPPELESRITKKLRESGGVAFDRMAQTVDESGAKASRLLGISPAAIGLQAVVANARAENLKRLENAGRVYAQQVREILDDPDNEGLRVEELAALISERGQVSASRAMTIARTETTKLNAQLQAHRAKSAGVARFEWSTSNDERVRTAHRDLNGQTFNYDDPPPSDVDGGPALPGEPINCRCVAIPLVGEGDEEELPDDGQPADEETEPQAAE